jgi:ribosomal protein S7
MKITKQLLEEMVKEELNEDWKDAAAGIGIAGTVAGIGSAINFDQIDQRMHEYQVEILEDALQNMEPDEAQQRAQAVLDGEDDSIPVDMQRAFNEAAQNYLDKPVPSAGYTDEPDPASSWNENRSRIEQLIAEELQKVLKA